MTTLFEDFSRWHTSTLHTPFVREARAYYTPPEGSSVTLDAINTFHKHAAKYGLRAVTSQSGPKSSDILTQIFGSADDVERFQHELTPLPVSKDTTSFISKCITGNKEQQTLTSNSKIIKSPLSGRSAKLEMTL